jgi:hypothetical protein
MWDLTKETKAIRVLNAVAAGQTTQNSSIIDMGGGQAVGGFDAITFYLLLNTVTATSVITLIAQDNALNQAGGMATITDVNSNNVQTQVTDAGGTSSNGVIVLDVAIPQLRYLRAQVTIGTANTAIDGILAVLYRSKNRPTALDASVIAQSYFVCKT